MTSAPAPPFLAHAEPAEAVVSRLACDPARGLSAEEAEKRLIEHGPNSLAVEKGPSRLRQFFGQFADPIVLTLLVAAIVALVEGASRGGESILERFGDATAILLIVVLNAVLGYVQEVRAEAALEALKKMQTPNARVRRDDRVAIVDATRLVPGDVLELEAGDAVAADARLLESIHLTTEEAALTGESMPVKKDARAAVPPDAPMADRSTMVFVGTSVVRGKGRAIVVATGAHTELGKVSALMSGRRQQRTPLEERLAHFGKRILWACLGLSTLLFVSGVLRGRTWHSVLLEAVSLAVAAIPEGLPAITTITLALGMQRMARRGALVRKLAAVETLGAATVICTDKTGTLTQNQMTVRRVAAGGIEYRVTGAGYDPSGALLEPSGAHVENAGPSLRSLLESVALCNNARLEQTSDGWRMLGDPTEGALLTLAAKGGVHHEPTAAANRRTRELPFDSDRKRMTVVTQSQDGGVVVHTKGSADILLPLCDSYATDDGIRPLDDEMRARYLREVERWSGDALRVLGVARRSLPAPPDGEAEDIEQRLTFVGLVGMIDPPREGVKEAVRECCEARVRAVMITGDHKLTAEAIAKELGLWEEGAASITGAELERLSDDELAARVEHVRVFARVTAEQKLRIVQALKKRGHVVAMTGDGVNDAPALREAHIGVAMGKSGTDVAREAADMVIADDNFATIVHAIREGRAIWRNIQKFIFFLLSSNAGLVVTVFVAAFIPGLEPLTPLMILWINLVTNGLPALALGVDPPDPTQMLEPPRKASAGLLGRREYLGIGWVGVWMGAIALACYLGPWAANGQDPSSNARAMAFSALALSPLFHAFNCRSPFRSAFAMRPFVPLPLLAAVFGSASIHLVAVAIPALWPVFKTFAMDAHQWLVLLVLAASIIPAVELAKLAQRIVLGNRFSPRRANG